MFIGVCIHVFCLYDVTRRCQETPHDAESEGPGTAANSTPPDTIGVKGCGQRLSQ